MTKLWTDSSTALAEATLNKMLAGDGYTGGIYAVVAWRISYDGANWGVSSSFGTKQSAADVVVAWNSGDNRLDVDISGIDNQFTSAPSAFATPLAGATHASGPRYYPQATVTSVSDIVVRFIDAATSTTAYATTESTKMAFNLLLIGTIG